MKIRPLQARRFVCAAFLASIVAVVAIAAVPAASESSTESRLFAFVVPTTRGPLPACSPDGSDCTNTNAVRNYIYIVNANRLMNLGGTRATMPNAFVVSSVDSAIFANGVHLPEFDATLTPPPNAFFGSLSGNWPSTVTCPPSGPPCDVVGSPAVDPGENTTILHTNWFHANNEPNGAYVFKFTVHGTLNGTSVDLQANSPTISMTD
jgi:hypothetical protein